MQAPKKTGRICLFMEIPHAINYMWTPASLSNLVTKGRKFGHIPGEWPLGRGDEGRRRGAADLAGAPGAYRQFAHRRVAALSGSVRCR